MATMRTIQKQQKETLLLSALILCLYNILCAAQDVPVRLVGGASSNEGRVEVYHDDQWGTVCDDLWDDNDASVVCRQLGLGDSGTAVCCADFGQGVDPIWLDNVDCSGSESNIGSCGSNGWGSHNCGHREDAGVWCLTDINECISNNGNCPSSATCSNTMGSFTCICPMGFFYSGSTCADIDECSFIPNNCSPVASCMNTIGSFTCSCNAGYSGDGSTCVDTIPPTIFDCPTSSVTVFIAIWQMQGAASWTEPTATDVSGVKGVFSRTHTPGSSFPLGQTTVTYTFWDNLDNRAQCQFVISVITVNIGCPQPTVLSYGDELSYVRPTCIDVNNNNLGMSTCTPDTGTIPQSTIVARCQCRVASQVFCTFEIKVKAKLQCPISGMTIPPGTRLSFVNPFCQNQDSSTLESLCTPGSGTPITTDTVVTCTCLQEPSTECSFTVFVDCTALTNGDPSCGDTSCQCTGNEDCNSESGSCSKSCSVFECPADIGSKSLSTVNPFLYVDINCILTASTAVLNRFDARLSRNENILDQDGFISLTAPIRNDGKEQTTYRVTNVTGEEDLYCILVRHQNLRLIGRVKVMGFVYELPSLGTAPTLITKSNTSITIRWNAWNPQADDGDPPVVGYILYYCMNSSDEGMPCLVEVLSEETREFKAENLKVDTLYNFSVAAVREGDNGEGPRSPLVTVKTFCNVPLITADVTALFTPSNEINISWLLPPGEVMCSTGVTKFSVYYKIEGSSDERLEMAGTVDDDTSIRWFVIDGRSLQSETKYVFFVTFTTDQESLLSEKTEDSVLQVPLFTTASAPLYLISLIIIPILLTAVVIVFFIVRYRRHTSFKDKKTTKEENGEDEDYVNAAIAHDPEDYIPLEKQSKTVSSSKYEDLNRKPQNSLSIPSQYEVTIVPERQRPVAPPIQTRNMKGIKSGAYEDVGVSSETRQLPDVPQSDPSVDKDEDNSYEVPDKLEEYTGVYVNVKNKNKLKQPETIKVAEFEKFMSRTKEDIVRDIIHQFMSLPSGRQYPWSVAVKFQNKSRNFFKSILPYDHSRVKLDTAGSDARSDYINASYIKNRQGKTSFIAAQGPQEGTVDDFWKMVWQENVETIVMVTDTSEENKSLCSTYWPSKVNTSEVFDDITVLLMESTSYTTHTIRKLNLFKGNPKPEVHVVTQVHVHSWPYGGVPKETTSLMSIVKEVKTWQIEGGSCPLLVHCSNGVGATGTFIAIYVLMDIIRKNKDISVFDFVAKMREDRVDIVQTRIQYLFIFEFLLTVLQSTDSEISCDQLRKLGHAAIKLKSKKEFKVLQESTVKRQQVENCIGYSPENQHKNRFTSIVPDDEFRPVLKSQGNSYGCNSYINAFHLADFGGREFIMTQTPLTSTVEDFWRLVYDYDCTAIVMLNDVGGSDETLVQYWPGGGSMQYGLMKVVCTVTTKNDSYVHRQFQVAHKKVEEKSICVDHFAFCGWSRNQPDVPKLKQFIRYTKNKGPGPVLVHCINGIGLSGVYIIVATEIERLESRGAVDVCQSFQTLRKKCSFAIQSQEEYTLCYQILKEHLDNPEEYAVVY